MSSIHCCCTEPPTVFSTFSYIHTNPPSDTLFPGDKETERGAGKNGIWTEAEGGGGFPGHCPSPSPHVSQGIEWLTAAYQASFWVSVRSCPCFCPARAKYISPVCKCSTSPATRPPASSSSLPLHKVHVPLGSGGEGGGGRVCVRVCVCVCMKGLEVKRAALLVSHIQHSFLAFSPVIHTTHTHMNTYSLVKLADRHSH